MAMKYDFHAVDTHHTKLGSIIQGMEDNLIQIDNLKKDLMNSFAGAGATGYETVMAQLDSKTKEYHASLASVRGAIAKVAGSQGLMQVTDTNNGNRFNAIGA
ncbi:WXG100 family type VII secretion target [Nocardia sp. NPDC056000]|uniref:WXG100 family type VII secretion target n=1 Tax=Nocardia sp. NPDC056000 TaxID=3345674 RepID=UPI0035D73183